MSSGLPDRHRLPPTPPALSSVKRSGLIEAAKRGEEKKGEERRGEEGRRKERRREERRRKGRRREKRRRKERISSSDRVVGSG